MRQAEGPEPEVGGCVGNAAQAVLNRVDGLMHKDVSKVELKERICNAISLSTFYSNVLQMIQRTNKAWTLLLRHFQLNEGEIGINILVERE